MQTWCLKHADFMRRNESCEVGGGCIILFADIGRTLCLHHRDGTFLMGYHFLLLHHSETHEICDLEYQHEWIKRWIIVPPHEIPHFWCLRFSSFCRDRQAMPSVCIATVGLLELDSSFFYHNCFKRRGGTPNGPNCNSRKAVRMESPPTLIVGGMGRVT